MSKIILKNVRLSFPSLFKKAEFNGEQTKYEATFLISKKDQADVIAKIEKMIDAAAVDKWKKKPNSLKTCLVDGDSKDYDGYEGMMSIKAASNRRPTVLDRDKSPLVEEDGKPYAGCYVNASLELWVQDNSWGKRINCNLNGVQFFKDGESFGAGDNDSSGDFDEFDDDDDSLFD